jgi:hypothetical protein
VVTDQASYEVPFRLVAWSVDHPGVETDERSPVRNSVCGHPLGSRFRPQVVVAGDSGPQTPKVGRRQRQKGRRIDDARDAVFSGGGEGMTKAPDIHRVELVSPPAPDRDERRAVADRVAPGCCIPESGEVSHVPVDRTAGHARSRRGSRRSGE